MLLAQADDIGLADQGLAAGVDVHVHAQLLALADDVVNLVIGQVELVAVLGGPAAGAVQVAGAGGVQQNGPGNVAVVFGPGGLLLVPADEIGVEEEVDKGGLEHLGVNVLHNMQNELVVGMVRIGNCLPNGGPLRGEGAPGEFIHPGHQGGQVLLRIFGDVVHGLFDAELLQTVGDMHKITPCPLVDRSLILNYSGLCCFSTDRAGKVSNLETKPRNCPNKTGGGRAPVRRTAGFFSAYMLKLYFTVWENMNGERGFL